MIARTFTTIEAARRWRVRAIFAEEILDGFEECGYVARTSGGWRVTESGATLAESLTICGGGDPAVESVPAPSEAA